MTDNKTNHPGRKEIARRVELAYRLLMKGWTLRRVTKELRVMMNLTRATAGRAVTLANKRFAAAAQKTPEEIMALCANHLIEVMNDKDAKPAERTGAAKELARMFGLSRGKLDVTVRDEGRELTKEEKAQEIWREILAARAKQAGSN